jgi:uncharacterized membrane protein YdjX (TVP38/TMEM64 family)
LKVRALLPLVIIGIPIAVVAVLLANMQSVPFVHQAVEAMRDAGREWWAIPLFFVFYAVLALFLLPVGLLTAAAALAWGWQIGGLLDLAAATLAAIPPYLIARHRLPQRVEHYLEKHGLKFETTPEFFPLLILRIVPIVPYVALNYIAGLARFRFRDYLIATLLGTIPSSFLFAFFIDTLGDSAMGAATQLRIAGACVAIAALLIIGRWGARYAARIARPQDAAGRRSEEPEPPPERSSSPPSV